MKAALAERLEESIKAEGNGQADGGAQAPLADAAQPAEAAAAPAAAANGELVCVQAPFTLSTSCDSHFSVRSG